MGLIYRKKSPIFTQIVNIPLVLLGCTCGYVKSFFWLFFHKTFTIVRQSIWRDFVFANRDSIAVFYKTCRFFKKAQFEDKTVKKPNIWHWPRYQLRFSVFSFDQILCLQNNHAGHTHAHKRNQPSLPHVTPHRHMPKTNALLPIK